MEGKRNTRVIRQCLKCKKDFHPLRSSLSQGIGYFCSVGCSSSHHNTGTDNPNYRGEEIRRECETCGETFIIPKAWGNKDTRHAGRYCSQNCMGVARRDEKNYFWKDGSWKRVGRVGQAKWARAIKKRDGRRCRFCGEKTELQAHHINSWMRSENERLNISNGITLCKKCHIWVATEEQGSKWYLDTLKEPSTTTRLAPFKNGDDIVWSILRDIELHRNDVAFSLEVNESKKK